MYFLGVSPVFHARAGLGDRAVAVLAPSQLTEDRRLRAVRAGGARRLAWAEVCPAGWRARAYQRWRRGFSEASRLSLQPVIVSLCILVPGLMPSVRGCRSYGVADVVVGVVGACACWERAGMVGATTDAATVAMPSPFKLHPGGTGDSGK